LASSTEKATFLSAPHDEPLDLRAIASLIGLLLLGLVDNQMLSPVLREIAGTFDVSIGRVGATVSGYALAAAAAALVVGPLSDSAGRRPFLMASGITFSVGATAAYFAPTFALFACARAVTGASAGVISALVVATIADRVSYDRRGRAMSWVASAYFAAPILLVPVGSWLADQFGWRAIYVVFALGGLGLVSALWNWVPVEHAEKSKNRRFPSTKQLATGYLHFLKRRSTAAGAVSAFFVSGGITVFILYLGAHLGDSFGLSITQIGLVFLLSGLASLGGALGAGPVSDRIGKRPMAVGGSLALFVFVLAVPGLQAGIGLYVCLGLVGLAAPSRVAPLQSLVTELVSREHRVAYVALRDTLSQLGIAVSASAGALLYARGGFAFVCYFAALLSVLAAILLWIIREPAATKSTSPAGE